MIFFLHLHVCGSLSGSPALSEMLSRYGRSSTSVYWCFSGEIPIRILRCIGYRRQIHETGAD